MPPYLKVGKYILKKTIGEGAFAEVRLAVHEDTNEEFAVKVFDRSSMPNADFERDIKREIKIMQYLRHPNIVSIHQVLVTSKKLYLVMELVRGGELYDEIVLKGRVDERTSRKYFHQIVDAMVYCHGRGVVHRDLKPENLLLDGNGNVKITDFGMSWMKDSIDPAIKAKQLLQTQCGTPKYMPPEIIVPSSQGYDGEKLDAWECGMVLYALLAGYLPFSGEDDNTVFRSILRGKVKFPNHFSPGAKDLLSRLLDKDPQRRSSLSEIRTHFWFLVDYTANTPSTSESDAPTGKRSEKSSEPKNQEPKSPRNDILPAAEPAAEDTKAEKSVQTPEANSSQDPAPRESASGVAKKDDEGCIEKESSGEEIPPQTSFDEESDRPSPKTPRDQMIPKLTEPPPLKSKHKQEKMRTDSLPKVPALCLDASMEKASPKTIPDDTSTVTGVDNVVKPKAPTVQDGCVGSEDGVDEWNGKDLGFDATAKSERGTVAALSLSADRADCGEVTPSSGTPMSLRERIRTPLASMLKSLRSGAVVDGEVAADNKSSWFSQTSPSSVADISRSAMADEAPVSGVQGAMTLPFRKISRAFAKK